jgi:isochorismate synthase
MHQVTLEMDFKISETDYLTRISDLAFSHGFSLALWRLPNTAEKHLVISRKPSLQPKDKTLEDLAEGFIFAPFDRNQSAIFLPADFVFNFSDGKLITPQTPKEISSVAWLKESSEAKNTITKRTFITSFYKSAEIIGKDAFLQMVQQGISAVESGLLEKIVPSRQTRVPLKDSFDVVEAFQRLCDANPNAFISWVSVPGIGDWLGATPEILVSVEGGSVFKTVALAGTQPYHEGENLKSVAWTQKEIEEQALVNRYIISCFKKIRLREYEEHGPKTVVAGNLMHLRTDFTVDMKATNFPQLGSVMLQLLHPTSAVCGMPLDPALGFLKAHEGYDRKFYAGYLGPVNIKNAIHIFVNLRCMQLLKNEALLYAGAGVTIDSIPEKEWNETEIKLNTLLKAIS